MPSSNKTPYLQLNQWIGSDKPKRLDFNADNLKMDNALQQCSQSAAAHAQNSSVHVTATEKAQWNAAGGSGGTCGAYIGSGTSSRTVQLPGTPAFGFLFAAGQTSSYHSFSRDNFRSYSGFFSTSGCSEGIVMNGSQLTLTHSSSARSDGSELYYNGNGITYVYIFWS
jgi:hypothetical protein